VDGNLLPPSNVPIPQVGAMMTDILQDEVKHLASDTFSTGAQPMGIYWGTSEFDGL
jgi:hypothetical protein